MIAYSDESLKSIAEKFAEYISKQGGLKITAADKAQKECKNGIFLNINPANSEALFIFPHSILQTILDLPGEVCLST